jgi:hypothetical protein
MATTSAVPVNVEPEAQALVNELGMQAEYERMLDFLRANVPNLRRIEVSYAPPYDTGLEPAVWIQAWRAQPPEPDEHFWLPIGRWKTSTFPPEVCDRFTLSVFADESPAG